MRDFSGSPVAKTPCSQCRGPGSIPGQGTRSHMPPLSSKVQMLQLKIPRATTKMQCSQKKKKKKYRWIPSWKHSYRAALDALSASCLQVRWLQLWVTTTAAIHPVCLSRPVVALMQSEKNSGQARKTPRYLKTNHSLPSCLWDPFGVWTAVSVSPKVCFKEPQYPPFDIKQSAFDPWTFDIPVKCPQSCFNCRSQLQSFGSGQEQPLLWLPSFCFAYQSSWQAAKSIPNWGGVRLSSSPSEAAVLSGLSPCLSTLLCWAHSWKGIGVVQGRTKWD